MKVLIISTNRCRQPIPVIPYGASIVAQSVSDSGHDVDLLDLTFDDNALDSSIKKIIDFQPDVLGISIRNIDNNNIFDTQTYFELARNIILQARRHSEAHVVIGGAAVLVMPQELLMYTEADSACVGEGTSVFPEYLKHLDGNSSSNVVPGMMVKSENFVRCGPTPTKRLPQNSVRPDFRRWIKPEQYLSLSASVPIRTKSGCPFNCIYCTYGLAEGREYQIAPVPDVISTITNHIDSGLNDFEFVDNVFNSPYSHAREICVAIKQAGVNARFQSMELNPAFVDDQLLRVMEAASFTGIGITAESSSDQVLTGLGKNYTLRHLETCSRIVAQHAIPCCWIFLLGGPGETEDSVKNTLDFASKIVRKHDAAFFNIGLRIYPGTQLETRAKDEGIISPGLDSFLDPVFYVTPGLSKHVINDLVDRAVRDNPNFISSDELPLDLLQSVLKISHRLGMRPPLWRYTGQIRRILKFLRMYK